MGFKSTISKAGSWLWSFVKTSAKKSEQEILDDLKSLAYPIVEAVGHVDLNGDDKIASSLEIIDAAKKVGLKWARILLVDGETEGYNYLQSLRGGDFRRYLALARISVEAIKKFGFDKTPTTHIILGIVQAILGSED